MKKNLTSKSNISRKRGQGFRKRSKSRAGKAILRRRRNKGRAVLSA